MKEAGKVGISSNCKRCPMADANPAVPWLKKKQSRDLGTTNKARRKAFLIMELDAKARYRFHVGKRKLAQFRQLRVNKCVASQLAECGSRNGLRLVHSILARIAQERPWRERRGARTANAGRVRSAPPRLYSLRGGGLSSGATPLP